MQWFFAKDESIERTLPVWQFQILLHVTLHHHDWPKNVCFLSFILNKMTKLFFVVSFISYKQTSHENITDLAFVWSQATITKSLNCAPIKHSIFWSEIKKKKYNLRKIIALRTNPSLPQMIYNLHQWTDTHVFYISYNSWANYRYLKNK